MFYAYIIYIYICTIPKGKLGLSNSNHIARSGATSTTCCQWALARPLCDGGPPLLGAFGGRWWNQCGGGVENLRTKMVGFGFWSGFSRYLGDQFDIARMRCLRNLEIPLFTANHLPSAQCFSENGENPSTECSRIFTFGFEACNAAPVPILVQVWTMFVPWLDNTVWSCVIFWRAVASGVWVSEDRHWTGTPSSGRLSEVSATVRPNDSDSARKWWVWQFGTTNVGIMATNGHITNANCCVCFHVIRFPRIWLWSQLTCILAVGHKFRQPLQPFNLPVFRTGGSTNQLFCWSIDGIYFNFDWWFLGMFPTWEASHSATSCCPKVSRIASATIAGATWWNLCLHGF